MFAIQCNDTEAADGDGQLEVVIGIGVPQMPGRR